MSPELLLQEHTESMSATHADRANLPHAGESSIATHPCERGPSDVYSLGMVLLDLIRGRLLTGEERRAFCACPASVHDDTGSRTSSWGERELRQDDERHGAFVTALVDSTFSASRLPHRRIYSLLPLVEQCLSANPMERPTIHQLLAAAQDAYKFCNLGPPMPPPLPPIPLSQSLANLNNMAIGDAQAGLLAEAREKWISALVMDPSNATALWNMSLFRWRTGEIDAVELITVLRRHEVIFGDDTMLRSEDYASSRCSSVTSGAVATCTPLTQFTMTTDDAISSDMEHMESIVLSTEDITTSASSEAAATTPIPASATIPVPPGSVHLYDECVQAVLDEALLCRRRPAQREVQASRPLSSLYPTSFLAPSVVASHVCNQLPLAQAAASACGNMHTALRDPYSLLVASPQSSGCITYDMSTNSLTEDSQQRDRASALARSESPKWRHGIWTYLDSSIDCIQLDATECANGNMVIAVPEIMHYYTTPLFVERLVGCDVAPSPEAAPLPPPDDGPILCYMLLEGQWEDDDYASGWNQADVDSVVEDDDVACAYSSDGSQVDSNLTAAPPKRQYFLVVIGIQGHCAGIMGVVNVEGIYFDQRPTAVSCWSCGGSIVVMVSGTGGLLCAVTPPAALGRSVGSITATQLSVDKYTSTNDDIYAPLPPDSHGASSSVTALDFSPLSRTLASGDSCGDMFIWKCSGAALGDDSSCDKWCFRQLAPPLHLKSRINSIVLSDQHVDAVVALDWRVLFVSLHTQSTSPTLFVRCILDSTCPSPGSLSSACGLLAHRSPPRYEAAFHGKEIVLWRVWSSPPAAAEHHTTTQSDWRSVLSVDVIRLPNPQMHISPSSLVCEYRYGVR